MGEFARPIEPHVSNAGEAFIGNVLETARVERAVRACTAKRAWRYNAV
jgi:hypothetical protein